MAQRPLEAIEEYFSDQLILGQRKVDEKSNGITAIPELLKMLATSGCLVPIDAIGTQTNCTNRRKLPKAVSTPSNCTLVGMKTISSKSSPLAIKMRSPRL